MARNVSLNNSDVHTHIDRTVKSYCFYNVSFLSLLLHTIKLTDICTILIQIYFVNFARFMRY